MTKTRAATVYLSLEKPGADLMKEVASNRNFAVAVADLYQSVNSYQDWLKGFLQNILGPASARAMIALAQRSDMEEVMAEARTGNRKVIPFPRQRDRP